MTTISTRHNATALILAGGRGTRIASLHPDLPKPMIAVAGVPFLEWLVRRLLRQGLDDIVIAASYKAEVIVHWAVHRSGKKPFCHREEQLMGTGGAIADALPKISTPDLVILNGDTLLLAEIEPALHKLQRDKLDGLIFARSAEDTSHYGRLEVSDGHLRGFHEKQPGRGLINGGIYIFRTEYLRAHLPREVSSFEVDILPRFLAAGARIGVVETDAPFIDIGTPESLAEAETFIENNRGAF